MINNIVISNRSNIKLSIRLNVADDRNKIVFLLHGLGSRNNYPHMLVLEEYFSKYKYNIINIDATNSLNESGSSVEGVTFSGYINDLEDVIEWAKKQSFYKEPFALGGQSLGAEAVVYYAAMNPNKVELLVSLAFPWLNGELESTCNKRVNDINNKGYYEQISKSTGRKLIIKKNYLEDLKKYNLESVLKKITARTCIIVGDKDSKYHIDNNKKLFAELNCEKELYILEDVPHDLANEDNHKVKLENALNQFLSK